MPKVINNCHYLILISKRLPKPVSIIFLSVVNSMSDRSFSILEMYVRLVPLIKANSCCDSPDFKRASLIFCPTFIVESDFSGELCFNNTSAPISKGTFTLVLFLPVIYCSIFVHDSVLLLSSAFANSSVLRRILTGEFSLTPICLSSLRKSIILDSPLLKTTDMERSLTQLIFNTLGILMVFLILPRGLIDKKLPLPNQHFLL